MGYNLLTMGYIGGISHLLTSWDIQATLNPRIHPLESTGLSRRDLPRHCVNSLSFSQSSFLEDSTEKRFVRLEGFLLGDEKCIYLGYCKYNYVNIYVNIYIYVIYARWWFQPE